MYITVIPEDTGEFALLLCDWRVTGMMGAKEGLTYYGS